MSWNRNHLNATSQGLRQAAEAGEFVPFQWVESIDKTGKGYSFRGCGWGQVAWIVAVMKGGVNYAKSVLPVGSGQRQVNAVLRSAGLTSAEIRSMTPAQTWSVFDDELAQVYKARYQDYSAYIDKSKELAEFFIGVLNRVPIEAKVPYRIFISKGLKATMATLLGSSAEGSLLEAA